MFVVLCSVLCHCAFVQLLETTQLVFIRQNAAEHVVVHMCHCQVIMHVCEHTVAASSTVSFQGIFCSMPAEIAGVHLALSVCALHAAD